MYVSHNIAKTIKDVAKTKNITIKEMLSELELGSNSMSAMYHGKMIASDSLARIADYLDVSVDYLLGRTDIPEINRSTQRNINIFPIDDIRGVTSNIRPAPTKVIAAKGAKGTTGEPKQKPRKTT